MKTRVTTSVTIVTQSFDDHGDVTGLPVILKEQQHEFDTINQVANYHEDLSIWVEQIPEPNGDMSPFSRRKVPPTEAELFRILRVEDDPFDGSKALGFRGYMS